MNHSKPAILLLCFFFLTSVHANDVVGPIIGAVDSTSARVLYRPGASNTKLRLSILSDGKVVTQTTETCTADNDFVAKFTVTNLQPAMTYSYRIEDITGEPKTLVAADQDHTFSTVDPARSGKRVSVGFLSCVDIEQTKIWSEMAKLDFDAVCLMGDTPYIDSTDLEVVRSRHRKFLQMPDLQKLGARTSLIGTWDDHDFGRNNGNGRSLMKGKANTMQGFVEYRAHAQFGNGHQGVYHKADLGMMEVFLLDPRYFSQTEPSPIDESKPSCFGTDQWEWLLKSLRESKAPFKVIAFGAIWQDKKNSETDDMFTYWYERDALLNVIREEQISGVMLLGGDIHVARHLIHPQRVGYDLHDFIISPAHKRVITELDVYHPSLEWSLVEGWQFLVLTADGTGDEPKLTADFRQPGSVVNRKVEIELASLVSERELAASAKLRAHWSFDGRLSNNSVIGDRINALAHNGATIAKAGGVNDSGALSLDAEKEQFVSVPRSFLDDNSAGHTISMWFKPKSLPKHGSTARSFLFEATAEGKPSNNAAWHLSLGLRAASDPEKINVQLYTHTLKPAAKPETAPTAISQGPFDAIVDRNSLLDQWNHVACTFDSKSLTLFLNGKQLTAYQLPIPGPASEFGGIIFGGHRAGTGRNFNGLIDEVSIWQGVLDQHALGKIFIEPKASH